MIPPKHVARQDRPISDVEADVLTRAPLVANIARALVSEEQTSEGKKIVRSTGFTVGLTGEWGSGKSSILYLLGQYLMRLDRVIVVTLNPWLFKGRDELIIAYFNSLRAALGRSAGEQFAELQMQLDRYRDAIDAVGSVGAAALDAAGGGGAASLGWGLIKRAPKARTKSPDDERISLERKLAAANVAVVVLIDELDRVEDEEVRAVAQLVKAVGDIKGISYLVAYDHRRVATSLGRGESDEERLASGAAYLEKIIQFAIPLRPLFIDDVRAMLSTSLEQNGVSLPDATKSHQQAILDALAAAVRTPREIKRLVGAFAVLEEIVRGEICPYDVLGYSWIATKLPGIRQLIADHIEAVVDDPAEVGMMARITLSKDERDKTKLLEKTFGRLEDDQCKIVSVLFPWFSDDAQPVAGDRLAKRRNLVRLLYLGDPPGLISRRDAEAVWLLSDAEAVASALQPYEGTDRLRLLLERVADFLPVLQASGGFSFWTGLSQLLVRPVDWISGAETRGAAVDDAAQMLWNHARQGRGEAAYVKALLGHLIAAGDLLIAPWLLRRQLFALRLVGEASGREEQAFLSKDETQHLLSMEAPRYRDAVLDGTVLRRLPDTEVIYTLANTKLWDDDLRLSLTSQLDTMPAISTFAALFVRPGLIVTSDVLNRLLDAAVVSDRLRAIVLDYGLPTNRWLAASVMRLQAVLLGRDATFVGHRLDDEDAELFNQLFGASRGGGSH